MGNIRAKRTLFSREVPSSTATTFACRGAFHAVNEFYIAHPEIDLIHGTCRYLNESDSLVGTHQGRITGYSEIVDLWDVWWKQRQFVQPEVFWTARIAEKIGPFRKDLNFVMDYEYWLRMLKAGAKVATIEQGLTCFWKPPNQKSTHSVAVADELRMVVQSELWDRSTPIPWWLRKQLQGKRLFDEKFRAVGDVSLHASESRNQRWLRLSQLMLRNPQLLLVPHLRNRDSNALRASKCPSAS